MNSISSGMSGMPSAKAMIVHQQAEVLAQAVALRIGLTTPSETTYPTPRHNVDHDAIALVELKRT